MTTPKSTATAVNAATAAAESAIRDSTIGQMTSRERKFILALGLGAFCCGIIVASKLFRLPAPPPAGYGSRPLIVPPPTASTPFPFADPRFARPVPCADCDERARLAALQADREAAMAHAHAAHVQHPPDDAPTGIDPPPPVGIVNMDQLDETRPSESGS